MLGSSTQLDHSPEPRTMRAARITAPRRLAVETVPLPNPGRSEVRVRLQGCGVCGSNLPLWQGRPWFEYPLESGAPGHEGWGFIDALGSDVPRFRIGDRVAFLSCRAYAEYDITTGTQLVPVPPGQEVFPGEALGCAENVFDRAAIEPGQTVAVIGIGFIGALLVQRAARAGAGVIAVSRRPFALDVARRAGAEAALRLSEPSRLVSDIMARTRGLGCERVIEAAGEQATLDLATELVAVGGRLVIAGYHQDGPRRVNMQLWNWRGIDVINAHERDPQRCVEGMRAACESIARSRLEPSLFYTHRFSLDELSRAFSALETRPDGFLKSWVSMA